MVINDYFYIVGDKRIGKSHIISSVNRKNFMTSEYIKLCEDFIKNIKLDGKTAILVAGGPFSHHSESRVFNNSYTEGVIALKSQITYSAYGFINKINKNVNVEYFNINGNTCASSMHCIYEAKDLIDNKDFDHVIVIAMEQVEDSELLLFSQLNIDLVCGDGVAFCIFSKDSKCLSSKFKISSAEFIWNYESHPMMVSKEGYLKLFKKINRQDIDIVKMHGTGTEQNDESEYNAIKDFFKNIDIKSIGFKEEFGHTQGASAIIELCHVLEKYKDYKKNILCVASGLGGFYGGCVVEKI